MTSMYYYWTLLLCIHQLFKNSMFVLLRLTSPRKMRMANLQKSSHQITKMKVHHNSLFYFVTHNIQFKNRNLTGRSPYVG